MLILFAYLKLEYIYRAIASQLLDASLLKYRTMTIKHGPEISIIFKFKYLWDNYINVSTVANLWKVDEHL